MVGFIHVDTCGCSSFILIDVQNSLVRVHQHDFIHSSANGHLARSKFEAITHSVAMNNLVHDFSCLYGHVLLDEIAVL